MGKWTLIATTELGYGKKKKTKEEKLIHERKFMNKIATMPKMDSKNVEEILDNDYKWFEEKRLKKESLFAAYKDGRLRSKRLIKEAKMMLKGATV